MRDFREILAASEEFVRAGQAHRAAALLYSLNLSKIPKELRLPLANVCRRANLLSLGLKILTPVVRGEMAALDSEKAEYAILLQRSGSVHEAVKLLNEINAAKVPQARLFLAFCHFNRWNYDAAVEPLQNYLQGELTPYAKLVGQVNLAAAFIVLNRQEEAEQLLVSNLEMSRELKAARLTGNSHELFAQLHLRRGDLRSAKSELNQAEQLFGQEETLDRLYVDKWRAVLQGYSGEADALEALRIVRKQGAALGDPESVRDADLYLQKFSFSSRAFHHLYFGTPFAGYRARIEQELGRRPESLAYCFGDEGAKTHMNLLTGEVSGRVSLKEGKRTHQVFAALLEDFYRPQTLNALFASLFPTEYFDPFTSPDRVYQAIRRSRAWIKESGVPIEIRESEGRYSLHVDKGFAFVVPLAQARVDKQSALWQKLVAHFPGNVEFRSSDAQSVLSLSATSFRRFANWAIETGRLERIGASSAVVYRKRAS